jgi:hypothetical protein
VAVVRIDLFAQNKKLIAGVDSVLGNRNEFPSFKFSPIIDNWDGIVALEAGCTRFDCDGFLEEERTLNYVREVG